jgi:hypothetical protein
MDNKYTATRVGASHCRQALWASEKQPYGPYPQLLLLPMNAKSKNVTAF